MEFYICYNRNIAYHSTIMQYLYSMGWEHGCRAWETTAILDTPKYAGIHTKSMGKVGPNHWSSNQVIFRTILVRTEDKTT